MLIHRTVCRIAGGILLRYSTEQLSCPRPRVGRDRLYDPECRSLHGTLGRNLRDAGIDIALYDLTIQT